MEELLTLKNKNAIITGARGGIGDAIVRTFARAGANVYACARKHDEKYENHLKSLADEYGVKIVPVYFDLSKEEEIKQAITKLGRIPVDILVNNAGVAYESTSFCMTDIQKISNTFATNFVGTTILTQYVVRLMLRKKAGSIIHIASVAALDGEPAQYEYVASKAALVGGTKQLARELAQYNIRVNCVAPGIIDTAMGQQINDILKEQITQNKVMMKRVGNPQEVANVVTFLASDLASYMTGQIVRVDGGI